MKTTGTVKFPHSVQLFKFCQKVLIDQNGGKKIHDQDIGAILDFSPSDCSHWKRGEKNVRSVFALMKLAESLKLEETLLHDIMHGLLGVDEAFFEWKSSSDMQRVMNMAKEVGEDKMHESSQRIEKFVNNIYDSINFTVAPVYLPEILRCFDFISTQQIEIVDRLSRILRLKPKLYQIQFRKGDMKAQTRMSIALDLARIVLEGERKRYPELGTTSKELIGYETLVFVASILTPKSMLATEMSRIDIRKNFIDEAAMVFWAPKSLVGFQVCNILSNPISQTTTTTKTSTLDF